LPFLKAAAKALRAPLVLLVSQEDEIAEGEVGSQLRRLLNEMLVARARLQHGVRAKAAGRRSTRADEKDRGWRPSKR
jgi:hypothetical protein